VKRIRVSQQQREILQLLQQGHELEAKSLFHVYMGDVRTTNRALKLLASRGMVKLLSTPFGLKVSLKDCTPAEK
jgi:Fe2+ or Zn2+ uptake regulation protein